MSVKLFKEERAILFLPTFPVLGEPVSLKKSAFDFLLAGLGILISSPMWALVAFAILLEDGFPILYGQERVGKNGRVFLALKFRTMHRNADEITGPVQAVKNDPRITRVGRVLRRCALDELPQLWNILKGDMSFVGPRPLRPGEILANHRGEPVRLEKVPGFHERITVIPGLTGLAQVYAPRDIPHREKFRYDLLYVKNRNFLLDLKLIFLSAIRTFLAKWD